MVPAGIWIAMVTAYFFERYGALHLQLYSISNNIVWHIANGVSGLIFIGLSFLFILVFRWGIISFPLALIVSSIAFFDWYSAGKSYRYFNLRFRDFEYRTSFFPLIIMIVYVFLSLVML